MQTSGGKYRLRNIIGQMANEAMIKGKISNNTWTSNL